MTPEAKELVERLRIDAAYASDRIGITARAIGRDCSAAADLITQQDARIAELTRVIIAIRKKGWLERRLSNDDDTDNYRGMAEYDAITPAGRAALAEHGEKP